MERLKQQIRAKNLEYEPLIYDLKIFDDEQRLTELMHANPSIWVMDEIFGQVCELVKLRNANVKYSPVTLEAAALKHIGDTPLKQYGVWVFYPWLNKLVHVLDRDEFIEVRTNRNQYKITPEEKLLLSTKRIGIIGLSVGNSIAMTMATERICGELFVSDFDILELSNLNRIQTGVQNLGMNKAVVVAREIAEMDPFFKVTCFTEGIHEANTEEFLTRNGNLDILVEVCDGLATKIRSRQIAKRLGIPVVMTTSDRGSTDIERFDLEPTRQILHGLIDHLDFELAFKAKTSEEKVPYILPIIGIESSSERLKASLMEIDETITTWPQLASEVILGGGTCTDVCRRILLNKISKSGRYYVDPQLIIDDVLGDQTPESSIEETQSSHQNPRPKYDYKRIAEEANARLFKGQNTDQQEMSKDQIRDLVHHATLAPSGGNIQPWKWLYSDKHLMLMDDPGRSASLLNYKNLGSLLSFGAATENLILRAHQMGFEVETNLLPQAQKTDLIAAYAFIKSEKDVEHPHDYLVDYIPKRLTNRNIRKRQSLDPAVISYLSSIVESVSGAQLHVFSEANELDGFKAILSEVDRLYLTNKAGHANFMNEVRWNQKQVEATRDGVDLNLVDLTPSERAGLLLSKNWQVTKQIRNWKLGSSFGKLGAKAVDAASALGIISMPGNSALDYLNGGRAVQRFWLACTEKNVAFQPMAASTYLFARVKDQAFEQIEDIGKGLTQEYHKFREISKLAADRQDVFFFRLAISDTPKLMSLRRNIDDVLVHH